MLMRWVAATASLDRTHQQHRNRRSSGQIDGSGAAVIASTADEDGMLGVAVGTTSSIAQIAVTGQANCTFDGATTAGDYVTISSTIAGDCSDAAPLNPTTGHRPRAPAPTVAAVLMPWLSAWRRPAMPASTITGAGSANYDTRWMTSSTLGTGILFDNGTVASVGTNSTGSTFNVYGGVSIGTGYVATAAPANGAIIQGNVGVGTTLPTGTL